MGVVKKTLGKDNKYYYYFDLAGGIGKQDWCRIGKNEYEDYIESYLKNANKVEYNSDNEIVYLEYIDNSESPHNISTFLPNKCNNCKSKNVTDLQRALRKLLLVISLSGVIILCFSLMFGFFLIITSLLWFIFAKPKHHYFCNSCKNKW